MRESSSLALGGTYTTIQKTFGISRGKYNGLREADMSSTLGMQSFLIVMFLHHLSFTNIHTPPPHFFPASSVLSLMRVNPSIL